MPRLPHSNQATAALQPANHVAAQLQPTATSTRAHTTTSFYRRTPRHITGKTDQPNGHKFRLSQRSKILQRLHDELPL
jgi:hypothetical protein